MAVRICVIFVKFCLCLFVDPTCNVLKTDPPTENNNSTTLKTDLATQALRTSLSDSKYWRQTGIGS